MAIKMNKRRSKKSKKDLAKQLGILLLLALFAVGNYYFDIDSFLKLPNSDSISLFSQDNYEHIALDDIPEYSDEPYVVVNANKPDFTQEDLESDCYEYYSDLDSLGRCGYTEAMLGTELMPTDKRESISEVKPSGWQNAMYDFVDGEWLYNRCHLIGFQLTGENANKENLITGTRYMNVEGMLPFENMIADYIRETDNRVMYRVTPIYEGNNLLASGVLMEAQSIEDNEIEFCIYAYNVQPGVGIDYATGANWEE